MKTRVLVCKDFTLLTGETLREGEIRYLEASLTETLVEQKLVSVRVATASRTAAILPERPSISAEKCRQ